VSWLRARAFSTTTSGMRHWDDRTIELPIEPKLFRNMRPTLIV